MSSPLERLAGPGGSLQPEAPDEREVTGLTRSALVRLKDARNHANSREGRFDLAYNAAHALSLAALRRCGFRAKNRYVAFQVLPHTVGVGAEVCASWPRATRCETSPSTRANSMSMNESSRT